MLNLNKNYPYMTTADLGGHKILGMSGSLTNYINTGNSAPVKYVTRDELAKKQKNKKTFSNILKLAVVGLAAFCGGKYLFKKKPDLKNIKILNKNNLESLKNKFLSFALKKKN